MDVNRETFWDEFILFFPADALAPDNFFAHEYEDSRYWVKAHNRFNSKEQRKQA